MKRNSFILLGCFVFLLISIPILSRPTARATVCPDGQTHIGIRVSGGLEIGQRMKVEADTPEEADYTLNILKASNRTVVHAASKHWGDVPKGPDVFFYIDLTEAKFDGGSVYIAQVKNDASDPKCGETSFTVRELNPVSFVAPTDNQEFDFGMKTLTKIEVTGVPSGQYKFRLGVKWKGDFIKRAGGSEIFSPSELGIITVTNICDNGEAFRDDCGDKFRTGKYTIALVRLNNTPLRSVSFDVADEGNGDSGQTGSFDITEDPGPVTRAAVVTILNFAIGMAGGVAFLLMIFGSYRLIFAGGNPESIQQGREVVTAAIIGLLVIVFSVLILRFLGIAILGIL